MALSTIFDLLVIAGAYRLGAYNARHPGDVADRLARGWKCLRENGLDGLIAELVKGIKFFW